MTGLSSAITTDNYPALHKENQCGGYVINKVTINQKKFSRLLKAKLKNDLFFSCIFHYQTWIFDNREPSFAAFRIKKREFVQITQRSLIHMKRK